MLEVKREFRERKGEVEEYFLFLNQIIKDDAKIIFGQSEPKRFKVGLTATLKSSGMLLLYNLVESTITNLLQTIHRKFSDENLKYDELSKEIQSIWFNYYYQNLRDGNIKDEDIVFKMKMIHDSFSGDKYIDLSFEEYTKYKNGSTYSGNLDAREIRKIFLKYGISLEDNKVPGLKAVKELRNKLAHGEVSFAECTRDMVPVYFNKLKEETISFLELVIQYVDIYLNEKKYSRIS